RDGRRLGGETMNPEEVRKLLGGYATGTLTPSEQEALFAAALEDQALFDALMAEQPLHDLLSDPSARAQVLASLDPAERKLLWWKWPGLAVGLSAAGVAVLGVALWLGFRPGGDRVQRVVRPDNLTAAGGQFPQIAKQVETPPVPQPAPEASARTQ